MEAFFNPRQRNWQNLQQLEPLAYMCGYCANRVSSDRGFQIGSERDGSGMQVGGIYICPYCQGPTFVTPDDQEQYPSPAIGHPVEHVPDILNASYEEARSSTSQRCYTAAVLLCRKMLMNIAVDQGAKEGLRFVEYVDYLSSQGFTPPNSKRWVDHIRRKGNEATHEIALMTEEDARVLLVFVEMLLKFIYEFPSLATS